MSESRTRTTKQGLTLNIPIQTSPSDYADQIRINARHYEPLCRLADKGRFSSLGGLLAAILDEALPHVRLVDRPKCDVVLVNLPDDPE